MARCAIVPCTIGKRTHLKPGLLGVESNAKTAATAESGLGRKRLTINTLSSLVYFTLLMAVGLWYTPFMLQRIPENLYGLVPLATSLTGHMVVIMTMITGPVCRYVSADFQRGEIELANATLNSFVFGGIKLVAILLLLLLVFVAFLPVSVPAGHETMARILFFSIGASFLISSMSSCFEVGYWVTHRFELKNLVEILVLLLRNGAVVALLYFFSADIWQIAAAALLAAAFQISMTYALWKRLAPGLRIDRHCQTEERKELIYSVGRWLIVSHIGSQLMLSTDLFLINRYFGTVDNTKYGIALLAATILRSVFSALGLILVPAMVTIEATRTKEALVSATARTMRVFGSIAAHATGILAGLALPVLTVWIKKPWVAEVAPFMTVTLWMVTFEISVMPLMALLIESERIKRFALGSLFSGIFAVGLAFVLLETTNLHLYAVCIPFALGTFLRHGLFNPILAAQGLRGSWHAFVRNTAPTFARFILTLIAARLIAAWLQPADLPGLLASMLLTAAAVLPAAFGTLPREDRQVLLKFVTPRFA
jgi:O-antigen/teichoic acid export membrane protein